MLYVVYAAMLQAAPDPGAGLAVLGQAESSLEPHRSCFFCPIAFTVAATHACARAGDVERAQGFLAESEAERYGRAGQPLNRARVESRRADLPPGKVPGRSPA